MPALMIPERVGLRAARRYVVAPSGCWESTCSPMANGYYQITWRDERGIQRSTTAHRAAWTHHHGPIREGLHVDHKCLNKRCVNPAHLRLLTPAENAADALSRRTLLSVPVGRNCRKGHPLTKTPNGEARCPTCNAATWQRYNARRKAARA